MGCSHSTSAAATPPTDVLSMEKVDLPAVEETPVQEGVEGSSHEASVKTTTDEGLPVTVAGAEEAAAGEGAVEVEEAAADTGAGKETVTTKEAAAVLVEEPVKVEQAAAEAEASEEVIETEEAAAVAVAAVEEVVKTEKGVAAEAIGDLVQREEAAPATASNESLEVVEAESKAVEEPIKTYEAVPAKAVEESVEIEEAPAAEAAAEAVKKPAAAPVDEAARALNDGAPDKEVTEARAVVEETLSPSDEVTEVTESVVQGEASMSKSAVDVTTEDDAPANELSTPEEVPVAPVSETKSGESSVLTFTAEDVTFDDNGVVFYNYSGSDASNLGKNDVRVSKRYSEFKALHAQLTDAQLTDLPALPKAPFLQARNSPRMLEDRRTQFTVLLNAIAAHPVVSQSDAFKAFLA